MLVPNPARAARTLLIAILALAGATSVPAADFDDPESLSVVVAARRRETPIEQIAGTVTVIGRAEIERRGWRTVPEALRYVPGLQVVQSGGPGKQTSVFARGTDSDHVLFLIDGIQVSDPSLPNGFDPAHLLTAGIERIEILRGPQSTLYGSEAVGAVVHVVTRSARERRELSGFVEAGAYHTAQYALGLRGSAPRLRYSLDYSQLHTRGVSAVAEDLGGHERDGYDNRTLGARLGVAVNEAASLELRGRFVAARNQQDPFFDDRDNRGETRQLFLRAEGRLELFDGRLEQRVGASLVDHDRSNQNDPDERSLNSSLESYEGRRLELDWQTDWHVASGHIATLGLSSERESLQSSSVFSFPDPLFPGESRSRAHASVRTHAIFLQEQFALADRWFGTAGARLDHHEEFGSHLTYRATAAFVHPELGTKLRASVGTAFKAPTLDELFGRSVFDFGGFQFPFSGNPDLDPEKSFGWELGIEQPFFSGRGELSVTWFQNRIRNLIEISPDFTTLRNVARARSEGLESVLSFTLEERLRIVAQHTYTSAESRETGEDLLRRPAHQASLTVELRPLPEATASLGVIYTGRRKDIDAQSIFFSRVTKGGYAVTNLAASYRLPGGWRLFARLDNLFDRAYQEPDGFGARGFSGYFGASFEY